MKRLTLTLALLSGIAFASHNTPEALEERTAPEGKLNIVEPGELAGAATDGPMDAETVHNTVCAACHGAGIAGAPATGDAEAWAARIEQGIEVLVAHAIEGYQGEAGLMPARGGNPNLSDEEVRAAVEFMVQASQ